MQNEKMPYVQNNYKHKYAQNMHKYAKIKMHKYEFSKYA